MDSAAGMTPRSSSDSELKEEKESVDGGFRLGVFFEGALERVL